MPAARVFARILRTRDLKCAMEAAGFAYTTDAGTADVHALRVYFATSFARAGVPLVMAQRLMRHPDPRLTAQRPPDPTADGMSSTRQKSAECPRWQQGHRLRPAT